MRREDIRLLARARQGDPHARCELGRRYLLGSDGFPRHVAMGVEHLRHPSVADGPLAARLLAEHIPLHQLIELELLPVLVRAAKDGSVPAQARLGAWRLLQPQAAGQTPAVEKAVQALQALHTSGEVDAVAVALLAAHQALAAQDLPRLRAALAVALALGADAEAVQSGTVPERTLAALVTAAVQLAEARGDALTGLPPALIRQALEASATEGDRDAAYALGRALCGIGCAGLAPEVFADHQNLRKGAAFLLRAADAGCDDAWLHLYRLHADHRVSVANPQMARFFLEKAALRGQPEAQRKLGALVLREAQTLDRSELAIHWLWSAAEQGDVHAHRLLQSLVLPVAGTAADAAWALEQVQPHDPWLAARLSLARHFGLTKLEALSVDPADGLRPWGLVVGRNPFIMQARLAAPRAIPALTSAALKAAQQAAALFSQAGAEGDLRNRSLRQRRLFDRLGIDEQLFFTEARSTTLESLRLGAKWAWRAREPLRAALSN
jgi:TPR repeat protein